VFLVNLLATLNFANFFKIKKNVWKIKNVTKIEKTFFYIYGKRRSSPGQQTYP